jgi:putative flippase GtrA
MSGAGGFSVLRMVELARYFSSSIIGTTVHYGVLLILVQVGTLNPQGASFFGALAGAVTIYALSYGYVFRSRQRHLVSLSRFGLVAALGLGVNGAVLDAALSRLGWPLIPAQLLATAAQFFLGFVLHRSWTFRRNHERQTENLCGTTANAAVDHRPCLQRTGGDPGVSWSAHHLTGFGRGR